ncbi:hypothetical protein ACIQAA_19305 [Neobacillus sp. NPDC093182]|uniref:hypothetical protein n=1 Tax=Neobacillus sp. NPDC093182 TaxID=3364297 RepID=UPI0037F66E10
MKIGAVIVAAFLIVLTGSLVEQSSLAFFGVPPAKRGFTTLRKYKYKKPNFSGVISEKLGFSYFRKTPFFE